MKVLIAGAIFFISSWAMSQDYPYVVAPVGYAEASGTKTVITTSSPIKSQDGLGLCYGFSATSLLEHYRCQELKLNCSDPKETLSSLDVTSYLQREELEEGGDSFSVLNHIANSKLKIAREECVKYSDLVYQVSDPSTSMYYRDEKTGWNLLVEKWKEYKGLDGKPRNDCVDCLVNSIKKELSIQTPAQQLKDAFTSARSLENFMYKSLLPKQCLDESRMASIPKFVPKNFPLYNETRNADALNRKVQSLLLSNIPVEMGICTLKGSDGKCVAGNAHSIALFGIKQVCRGSDCKIMVQVKNSYGNSWQISNDNGWLELDSLVEASITLGGYRLISWIERPGFVLTSKTLPKPASSASTNQNSETTLRPVNLGIPAEYRDHRGIWRCSGSRFVQSYEPGCVPYKP